MSNTQSNDSLRELNAKLLAEIGELRKKFAEIKVENDELKDKNTEIPELRRKFAELEAEKAELKARIAGLLKQAVEESKRRDVENAELKARIEELEKNKKDSSAKNVRRDVEIAEIKAEVVKLRDNNEESKQLTSCQSEVISKEMISGYDQNTIDEIEPQSSISSNTINLVSNVYEKEDVSDHALVPSAKSSEEKETDTFLNEVDKKMISDRIRQKNREKKLQRKNEQGLIQEINSSMKEKHILSAMTEISANQVRPNSLAERNEERVVLPDIINLYETMCGAEKKAIKANREETLRWCFYAREFKRMYKDFMVNNKVGKRKRKVRYMILLSNNFPILNAKLYV